MESNDSSLHHVSNEVILYLYVFRIVMKYKILFEIDPTLIVLIYHYSVQNLLEFLSKELP